ncbi:transporter substrate-binding domain-containing protein [Caulobacter sp. LARHSG274]
MNGAKIAVIGLALLVLSACQGAPPPRAANEIIVGTEGAYPPWNLTRPDGTLDGFEPELLKALCGRAGLRCRLVAQDWSGMIAALDAKKIDMIADSVVVTPARTQVVRFTDRLGVRHRPPEWRRAELRTGR